MCSLRSLAAAFVFTLACCVAMPIGKAQPAATAQPKASANPDAELAATAQGLLKDLRSETLPNGLKVYLLPVKGSPIVTTMVAYNVGSADEEKSQTGLSHYLEHLMFKGTDKLLPGDVDRATLRNGGSNNAYTSEDRTVYHFDFAADRWEAALQIEADRMRNVKIDAKHEFEQEKGAVIAELKMNEDRPWDLEYKAILKLLYPAASPYSHPVIGEEDHVRGATAEIIKRHYDNWYYPNNAALVVVGGFDPDAAMKKIKELFGSIPKGELPARKPPVFHQDREGPARKEIASKFDLPRMMMGFNTVSVVDPDKATFDIIDSILSSGRTARLYRKLVEDERIAVDIGTDNQAGRYPGWFGVFVEALKGKDRKQVEDLVFAELDKLAAEPVTDAELARARRQILARYVFSRETVHSLCDAIATTSTYPGSPDPAQFDQEYLKRVVAITKADIQRVAKAYLDRKKAVIVWSVPKEDGECEGKAAENHSTLPPALGRAARHARAEPFIADRGFSLTDAKRVVLPNGLTLILLEDHRLPMMVARVAVKDIHMREPANKAGVATLVGNLLEEGTTTRTGKQIASQIEDTGGSLSLSSSGASLRVLAPDADLGLGLLFDCLQNPSFPAEALDRQREQQVSTIEDNETQPREKADMLFDATIYGKHPLGRPSLGKKEIVEKLTAADCKAFHTATFVPNNTIAVLVGDFNSDEMAKKVEALTKDWKTGDLPPLTPPAPPMQAAREIIVSDPSASQVHVFIGHLGITRDNPDYHKLLVMDYVLGTGPGFTDRLSANLRDRQGLAYTVRAAITSFAGTQPGVFQGYIGTFPDKYLDVRRGFLKEVNRIRDEPATKQEVEDAKQYLLGNMPFRFTSQSAIAGQLLGAEQYGLGFDFLEKYKKEVAAVTPEDVQAVAKKYLDPKSLIIVAVGPIDAEGKPLAKKK